MIPDYRDYNSGPEILFKRFSLLKRADCFFALFFKNG